jgi:hypothetical protein
MITSFQFVVLFITIITINVISILIYYSTGQPTMQPSTKSSPTPSTTISHLDYENDEDVHWFYQPRSGTLRYRVHFEMSDIEDGYDYLLFSPSGTSDERALCTGQDRGNGATCLEDVYITSSTGIRFDFHSDFIVTGSGFSLSVNVVSNTPSAPTGQPSMQPSSQPSMQPSMQPSGINYTFDTL